MPKDTETTPTPKGTETPRTSKDAETTRAVFYARAGQSSDEFRKTLLTLSVGAVGVFFVTLTGEKAPELTNIGKGTLVIALAAFALAIFFSLLTWNYAGKDFDDKARCGADYKGANHKIKWLSHIALLFLFFVGVGVSAAYLFCRITTRSQFVW